MIDENKKRKIELNLDYKIKKIDNLLNGNTNLELYIESIENSNISVPSDMEDKIFEKLNIKKKDKKEQGKVIKLEEKITNKNENIPKESKASKNKYIDILKIAACTVFALILWEFVFSKQAMYASDKDFKPDKSTDKVYEKIEAVTDKISEIMMKPLDFERRDK